MISTIHPDRHGMTVHERILTPVEQVVAHIHDNLLSSGHSQREALALFAPVDDTTSVLAQTLTPEFTTYLLGER